MTLEIREYATEGHRLLVEHALSPSELAGKTGLPRQRITEWRTGRARPGADARRALEAVGIAARTWEAAPTSKSKGRPVPAPPALDAAAVETATGEELAGYGAEGLEAVVDRLRVLAPDLPPRERVMAIAAEGRLHSILANLRAKETDARREFLASREFAQDMRVIAAALPASAGQLRSALERVGVELPTAPDDAATAARAAPSSAEDVEQLLVELGVAASFGTKGEPHLAAAHVVALSLDVHANAIAAVLAPRPELAARFLAALDPSDELIVSSALERRMALADARALPVGARKIIAQLLVAHGLGDVAGELGAAS